MPELQDTAKQVASDDVQITDCGSCGNPVVASDAFCSSCGAARRRNGALNGSKDQPAADAPCRECGTQPAVKDEKLPPQARGMCRSCTARYIVRTAAEVSVGLRAWAKSVGLTHEQIEEEIRRRAPPCRECGKHPQDVIPPGTKMPDEFRGLCTRCGARSILRKELVGADAQRAQHLRQVARLGGLTESEIDQEFQQVVFPTPTVTPTVKAAPANQQAARTRFEFAIVRSHRAWKKREWEVTVGATMPDGRVVEHENMLVALNALGREGYQVVGNYPGAHSLHGATDSPDRRGEQNIGLSTESLSVYIVLQRPL
jgi:hypothetical protein